MSSVFFDFFKIFEIFLTRFALCFIFGVIKDYKYSRARTQ